MRKILIISILAVTAGCFTTRSSDDKKEILIEKYFSDDSTYVIVCKGFPKEGSEGIQITLTAKEAALLNAQIIARQDFDESIDVITDGNVEKYDYGKDYAVVKYVIKKPGLRQSLKKSE